MILVITTNRSPGWPLAPGTSSCKCSGRVDSLRVLADKGTVRPNVKARLKRENRPLNPAAIQRQIQALCTALLTLTTAKQGPKTQPAIRAKPNDSTKQPRRAS